MKRLLLASIAVGCRAAVDCPDHAEDAPDEGFIQRPDDGAVFDPDVLHRIELTLSDEAYDVLVDEVDAEVRATLVYDGETVEEVGLSVRGGLGSYQEIDRKPKLGIDFDEFVDDRRFHDLKRLHLNNAQNDCSYLHEPLGYRVFAQVGVPAARTAFATVTLDGEDYGLYVVVEPPDDQYLEARFADPQGNLYDGRYLLGSERWPFTRLDFGLGFDDLFPLEEGINVDHDDIEGVSEALIAVEEGAPAYPRLGEVLDWGEVMREWAADHWMGETDGYTSFRNNYLVYFGEDGRAQLFGVDLDEAFSLPQDDGRWRKPKGRLAYACWADPACAAVQAGVVRQVVERTDEAELQAWLEAADDLTRDAALGDDRRTCARDDVVPAREALADWIDGADDALLAAWCVE